MRDFLEAMVGLIVGICCVVSVVLVSAFLSYAVYSAVMATDWPDWVKYLILH